MFCQSRESPSSQTMGSATRADQMSERVNPALIWLDGSVSIKLLQVCCLYGYEQQSPAYRLSICRKQGTLINIF